MNKTPNESFQITDLREATDLIPIAAEWFHEKWHIPKKAYKESMVEALSADNNVPSWYVVLNNDYDIIAGIGVIENDFHEAKDLRPNLCALYVDERYRHMGIARSLLDNACAELGKCNIEKVYLLTSHTEFYEKCGFDFYSMVRDDEGDILRVYCRNCVVVGVND